LKKQTVNSAPDEEADEEEFEIERILAYEPNRFISEQTKKKIGGFFVKWKGYTSDDNSWVSVDDCHAEDLISDFWEQHPEQHPKPKNQVTTKGGKGKLPSLEISSSKSKSRSRYEDAMEVDSDDRPKKQRYNAWKRASSSSAGASARANGKSFSKLKREATESADEHALVVAQPPSDTEDKELVKRFDLMNISRTDMRNKAESVQTVEMNNGKLFYFINLKDGTRGAAASSYVRRTIPELALDFMEGHLKWKEDFERE